MANRLRLSREDQLRSRRSINPYEPSQSGWLLHSPDFNQFVQRAADLYQQGAPDSVFQSEIAAETKRREEARLRSIEMYRERIAAGFAAKEAARQAKLRADAAAARLKLKSIAALAAKHDKRFADTVRRAADPLNGYADVDVIGFAKEVETAWNSAQAERRKLEKEANSLKGKFLRGVGRAVDIIDTPAAFIRSGLKESGDFVANTLGAKVRKDSDRASWRQFIRQGWDNVGFGEHAQDAIGDSRGNKWLMRGLGLLGDVATDPLTRGTAGLGKQVLQSGARQGVRQGARQAGISLSGRLTMRQAEKRLGPEVVAAHARQGRIAQLGRSEVLQTAVRRLEQTVISKGDAAAVRKAVPGLSEEHAERLVRAHQERGLSALRREAQHLIVSGRWTPKLTLGQQAAIKATGGRLGTRGISKAGTLSDKGMTVLRRIARGDTPRTATLGGARSVSANALDAAMRRARDSAPDFWNRAIRSEVEDLDNVSRVGRLWEQAEASGNAAFVEAVERELRKVLPQGTDPQNVSRWAAGNLTPDAQRRLVRLETLAAVLGGAAGEAAQRQAAATFSQGLDLGKQSARGIVERAAKNVGLGVEPLPGANVRTIRAQFAGLGDPNLRDRLLQELEEAAASGGRRRKMVERLGGLADALHNNPELRDEAARIARNLDEAASQSAVPQVKGIGLRSAVRGPANLLLSVAEAVPPSAVAFEGTSNHVMAASNRVEAIDRWVAALGGDDFLRSMMRTAARRVETEEQLYNLVERTLRLEARKRGVDEDVLIKLLKENQKALREGSATLVGPDGTIIEDVQTIAQRKEFIALPDPADIRAAIDSIIVSRRGLSVSKAGKKVRGAARNAANKEFLGSEKLTAANVAQAIHRNWKFIVVTNLYAPAVGAAAGYLGEEGSTRERLEAAGVGAAIGVFGPVRYLGRVVGIEENARIFLYQGFASRVWVPFLSKRARTRGLEKGFISHDLIRSNVDLSGHIKNPLFVNEDKGWVALGRKQPRFVDGWWRVVNRHLHDDDPVAKLLLQERAGAITAEQADRALAEFFATADGRTWLKRMRGGRGGPSTRQEAIDRYRNFINTYVPPDIAAERLTGVVSHERLKQAVRAGNAPEFVHAQKTWVIPRNMKQVRQLRDKLSSMVLESATSNLNRNRMAENIYRDEFLRLRRNGVPLDEAQRIADEFAVRRTNEVMFNVNDESRFAKKVDFGLPFQQPREELVRVWAPLVLKNNKLRTMAVSAHAAMAFNDGVENGTFSKDPVSGEWTMTVPGSFYLSRLLGAPPRAFEANLRDLVFFGQGAFGINVIPSPGGPFWATLANSVLDTELGKELIVDMPDWLRTTLFPYGRRGELAPKGSDRLWMAMFGGTPPWEFASEHEQENQLNRVEQLVVKELIAEHLKKHPADLDWLPSEKEVKEGTRALLRVWAALTNFSPAGPRPVFPSEDQFWALQEIYKDPATGKFGFKERERMLKDHPHLEPFLRGVGPKKWTGPDDWSHFTGDYEKDIEDRFLRTKQWKSAKEYAKELKQAREDAKAYAERQDALDTPNPIERANALYEWRQKYPELAAKSRNSNLAKLELARILRDTPRHLQDDMLDEWRKAYDVRPGQYKAWRADIENGKFPYSPWRRAREMEDVAAEVERRVAQGFDERTIVSSLSPAEQVRYWDWKLIQLIRKPVPDKAGAAAAFMDEWWVAKTARGQVFRDYKHLIQRPKEKTPYEQAIERWRGDYRKAISDAYTQAAELKRAMERAKDANDWKTFYALQQRRNAMFDLVETLKNEQYKSLPELPQMQEELKAVMDFIDTKPHQRAGIQKMVAGVIDGTFLPSNEELTYLNLPEKVKEQYIKELVDKLDLPAEGFVEGKLFYEWLTDFQKDLLEANVHPDDIEMWKRERPQGSGGDDSEYEWRNGKRYRRKKFGGRYIGEGGGELAFAVEMFRQWNKRPEGATAPAAYAEYLTLPPNSVVRSEFLAKHPEVQEWIRMGPMANMPPVLKYLVADIMVKYGKWTGQSRDYLEITELAFAQEQLTRWNKRTGERPQAYDLWLNMPSGPEKAEFLRKHPEVKAWIAKGPMANMPDDYKEVVRDIMLRYGQWTQRDDPLGQTIAKYYSLPSHAREQFLAEHPELVEYWAAARTPEEQRMYDLADRYFAIQDQGAKRLFMAQHPELQDWFIQQRTKRYERFLNRVAHYMGQNPDVFNQYLERQEDVLAEMLNNYAESALVRELPRTPKVETRKTTGDSGRQRRRS